MESEIEAIVMPTEESNISINGKGVLTYTPDYIYKKEHNYEKTNKPSVSAADRKCC